MIWTIEGFERRVTIPVGTEVEASGVFDEFGGAEVTVGVILAATAAAAVSASSAAALVEGTLKGAVWVGLIWRRLKCKYI